MITGKPAGPGRSGREDEAYASGRLADFEEGLEAREPAGAGLPPYEQRQREVRDMIEEADRQADEPMGPDGLADALTEIADGWAKAALSASPAEPGLDVERLARALNESVGSSGWLRLTPSDAAQEWRKNARIIAAEYARLAEPKP